AGQCGPNSGEVEVTEDVRPGRGLRLGRVERLAARSNATSRNRLAGGEVGAQRLVEPQGPAATAVVTVVGRVGSAGRRGFGRRLGERRGGLGQRRLRLRRQGGGQQGGHENRSNHVRSEE